jgi:hypothetical protein
MYEYKFIGVIIEKIGLFSSDIPNYKDIISLNAQDGWRFVQIIATEHSAEGRPWTHEVIFEKEIK